MLGPNGERCVLYNWDRPLTKDLALRLKSASCESRKGSGLYISHDISRTVIPLSESSVQTEQGGAAQ
jgi:hypothetical protein